MAMRVTTKMMQNTAMRNLNTSKDRIATLTNQLSTGKKITRASDDPVVALRSLKLNMSLDKIDQYYENNSNDAQTWLDLTESAIDTVAEILGGSSGMKVLINQAANSYNEDTDISAIVSQLIELAEEIYTVGNADNAGRYLFTGYRTDIALTFTEDTEQTYKITEQLTNLDMDTTTYVAVGCLMDLNEGNFNSDDMDTTEFDVTTNEIYRFRLAYDTTDTVQEQTDDDGNVLTDDYGNTLYEPDVVFEFGDFSTDGGTTIYSINKVYDEDGNQISTDIQYFDSATEEAYMTVVNDPDAVVYIASTGELLLGANVAQTVSELSSDTEVRISYEKTNWDEGDLNPVHYFYCETQHATQDRTLVYNESFLTDTSASGKQIIEYDVGNNQTIRVNTTADEVYTHDIGRDIEELQTMVEQCQTIKDNKETIQAMIDSGEYTGDDLETLTLQLEALEKAETYYTDKIENYLEELLDLFDGYIEQTNEASTSCGTRSARLEIIQSRLSAQQASYEELVSENEDADYSELAVQLASVQTTYDAALSAISYVLKTSLLDYI